MFNRIVLSFGNQMTGPILGESEVLEILDLAGRIALKTVVLLPSQTETLTATAQGNLRTIRGMIPRLNRMDTKKLDVLIGRRVAAMVRDGFEADIAIGDDLAVAINKFHDLPTAVDGRIVSRASMSTPVLLDVLRHVEAYVSKYDSAKEAGPDEATEAYAEGQVDPRAIKAAAYVLATRKGGSTGYCARHVRKGFQHAKMSFVQQPAAYQYHTTGQMSRMGYSEIENQEDAPIIGDVIVFDRYGSKYPSGHIAVYSAKGWVSDFLQKRANPYSSSYKGESHYYRFLLKGGKPKGGLRFSETRTIKESKLLLRDIKIDTAAMREIAERTSRSMSLDQYTQLLRDLSAASNVPLAVLSTVAKYENGYPSTKSSLLRSSAWEVSKSFRGPFQIGKPHWADSSKEIKSVLGVKVSADRTSASIAQQGVATILYVMRYAKAYKTLGALKLSPELFYLLHNMGPGGLIAIVGNGRVPSWLVGNAAAQSPEVRKVIARHNPALGRLISI